MRLVILYYSFTGNNRLLAETLAARIGCPAIEVIEQGKRRPFQIAIDLLFRRFPRIRPIDLPAHDHVLVVAPLWNRWIAHPMRTALKALGPEIGAYSFASLSGGERPGQVEFVADQLEKLTGAPPRKQWAMYVERVAPEAIRGTPKISEYKMSSSELARFPEIDEIIGWMTAQRQIR